MPSKPKIWTSDCLRKQVLLMEHDGHDGPEERLRETIENLLDTSQHYKLVSPEYLPTLLLVGRLRSARKANLLDFFRIQSGLPIVSQRLRDVMEPFDLGDTAFHPLRYLENDRETERPEGPYYFLNVASVKPGGVVFEESEVKDMGLRWRAELGDAPKFTIRAEAATGADLWAEPTIHEVVFFSNPLAKAIKAAKIKGLKLYQCEVVGDAPSTG